VKHKVAELEGALLDAAAAKAEGYFGGVTRSGRPIWLTDLGSIPQDKFRPSSDSAYGFPIIEREGINLFDYFVEGVRYWGAHMHGQAPADAVGVATSALVAAMRTWVVARLGAEIELP
jgi:Protein of unknown function (DUF2591)